MTSRAAPPTSPRDTALLLGRLVRLRVEWRLSPGDVQTLVGASEASLVRLVCDCGGVVAERIQERVRCLDEIASLVWATAAASDPAEWLRTETTDLDGRTPLDTLSQGAGGLHTLHRRLCDDYEEARR